MNSTTFEAFTSQENTDTLINLCVSSLNIDPTQEFLSILQGISLSVFNVEGYTNSLGVLNGIVVKEVSKYIIEKRKDLFFKVISPKKYSKDITLTTETICELEVQEITSIFLDEIRVHYSSNNVVNSATNTFCFKERMSEGKDLWSDEILIELDPGNYTAEEYLEELEFLMTTSSKAKNFYNFFYDRITDKVSVFTTEDKLDWPTRNSVRSCEKKGDFLIIPEKSTTLRLLGFSQPFDGEGKIFTGKTRMKYFLDPSIRVSVCDEEGKTVFDFEVLADGTPVFALSLGYDTLGHIGSLTTHVVPEDTEITIAGRIEYVIPS